MLYNLRSDIIYYRTGSDFELEFNLCGCCRMRLLTDKPTNKKAFVHSLARAVSRSRVILIAGPLFGLDSTIQTVAQALGTTTEIVDNATYNISSDDEIEIIKGSLPLVAGDGSFGGCIIESGPQTMILLTDNKTLRKNIMTNLIHPYVSELYSAELKLNSTDNSAKQPEPVVEEEPTAVEEFVLPLEEVVDVVEETTPVIEEITVEATTEEAILEGPKENKIESIVIPEEVEEIADNTVIMEELYTENNETQIEEIPIILETVNDEQQPVTEVLDNTFEELYLEEDKQEDYVPLRQQPTGYQVLYDDGEVASNSQAYTQARTSRLNVATIIVTVILLVAIITLCITIFSASSTEGIAPAEYIRNVWQTVFG